MKEAKNFLPTVSALHYKEFQRWIHISIASISIIIIALVAYQLPPLYTWWNLRCQYYELANSTTQFEQQLAEKRALKEARNTLDTKIAKLERYQRQHKNPVRHIERLHHYHYNHTTVLNSISIQGKKIEIMSSANNQHNILQLITLLGQEPLFADIDLVWLKQNNAQEASCLIKGACIFT